MTTNRAVGDDGTADRSTPDSSADRDDNLGCDNGEADAVVPTAAPVPLSFTFDFPGAAALAEHAMTASGHADPIDDEPAGPALLMACDDGVYLLSNGDPQLPPDPAQPPHSTVRAVFSHQAPSMATPSAYPDHRTPNGWPSREAFAAASALDDLDCHVAGLPLTTCHDGMSLIDVIRAGVTRGHHLLRMTFNRDDRPTITTE